MPNIESCYRGDVKSTNLLKVSLFLFLTSTAVNAQTITVQLLNGANAKPLKKILVYVGFNDLHSSLPLRIKTDANGQIQFDVKDAQTFQIHPIGVVACDEQPLSSSYPNYKVSSILQTGAQSKDDCGIVNLPNTPGRLILFGKRATAWQMLRE